MKRIDLSKKENFERTKELWIFLSENNEEINIVKENKINGYGKRIEYYPIASIYIISYGTYGKGFEDYSNISFAFNIREAEKIYKSIIL